MSKTKLDPIVMGLPWAIVLDAMLPGGAYVDFASTKGYLFLVSKTHRVKLVYEPGGGSNDGEAETVDDVPALAFRLPAEFTRDDANFPVTESTDYEIWFNVGDLTGSSAYGKLIDTIKVHPLPDGLPVS